MVVPGRDEDRVWTKVCVLPGSFSYIEEAANSNGVAFRCAGLRCDV